MKLFQNFGGHITYIPKRDIYSRWRGERGGQGVGSPRPTHLSG